MNPLLIAVAPNGARRGKADHPEIPLTLPEIVTDAQACAAAGAAMLHLHVRDDHGRHSLDAGRYREALAELSRSVPHILLQITTEAADRYAPEAQLNCLKAVRPDFASVATREIARDMSVASQLYRFADEAGIVIQHILYDTADLALLQQWRQEGLVPAAGPQSLLFVLGRYATAQLADPNDLLPFLSNQPGGATWSLCAFGRTEASCCALAMALGGHVRVGFENNLHLPDGRLAGGNADLVARIADMGQLIGRPPADAETARRILSSLATPTRQTESTRT
mgnify:FL=1